MDGSNMRNWIVSLFPRRPLGAAGAALVQIGILIGTSTMVVACGEADPGLEGEGGSGGSSEPERDPLNLSACDTEIGVLAESVALPELRWSDGGDDHEAYCAFRALDAILEDKTIICLGENDHGVAETSRWNSALVRYLVHRWDVRVIAIEGDMAGAEHWNRYLVSGDELDLARGAQASKDTLAHVKEAEYFVKSLRLLQAELPEGERLRYTGFDIAVQPTSTIEALLAFFQVVDPERGAVWNAEIRNAPYADAASSTERLLEAIDENREPWVAATDEVTWKTARANALNLIDGFKFLEYYAQGNFGRGNALYREPGMIRNVGALASNLAEGERLLLIGHNLHCSKKTPASGANTIEESPALGTAIARSQEWGHKYLVLAQIYHRGEHILLSARLEKSEFQSSESSVAGMLAKITDAPALLIGTDATEPPMHQQIDLAPFGVSSYPLVPAEQFDAFLWLDEVSATTPR